MYKGILIPIGGNEDKGRNEDERHRLDFVKEGILSRVVRESGGIDAKIVIIPTASSIPVEVGENYLEAFGKLGCTNLKVLDIRTREESNSEMVLKYVSEANCIMFSGGDQSRISEIIGKSKLHRMIIHKLKEEPVVVAGTSAGAMGMSDEMICGGSSVESLLAGAVLLGKGLGLVPELIIDSHFVARGRFGRLAEAVAQFPRHIGIGLAEDTGIIIRDGKHFKVIGSGMVILFDGSSMTHNNASILDDGTPMTITDLKTHVLSNGDQFHIKERRVEVLPMEAEFEL